MALRSGAIRAATLHRMRIDGANAVFIGQEIEVTAHWPAEGSSMSSRLKSRAFNRLPYGLRVLLNHTRQAPFRKIRQKIQILGTAVEISHSAASI